MRKPRDYDAELKQIDERAKQLRARKVQQLGELLVATGADTLPAECLAGALLAVVDNNDTGAREAWRKRGAAFFQRSPRVARIPRNDGSAAPVAGGATPTASEDRT